MSGWRDAPLVGASPSPKAGSWRDAPLIEEAPAPKPDKPWSLSLGPAAAVPGEYFDTDTPQGKALLAAGLGAVAGPAAGAAASALTPLVGSALAHPIGGGVAGAALGYLHGGLKGALIDGVLGAAGGPMVGLGGRLLRAARSLPRVAETAAPAVSAAAKATPEAIAATEAAVRGARTVSPTLSNVTFNVGSAASEAAPAAKAVPSMAGKVIDVSMRGDPRKLWAITDAAGTPVQTFTSAGEAMQTAHAAKRAAILATTAAEAAPTAATVAEAAPAVTKAAPAVSGAAAAATRHNALMQFAKDAVAKNPKVGEKIWVALDDAGNPVRVLTPDQAGAAKRAGQATTWVKNLWR